MVARSRARMMPAFARRVPAWLNGRRKAHPPLTSLVEADICLILEGAYPYVIGGVSGWLQDLIENLPDVSFHIVAIKASAKPQSWKLTPPANVLSVTEVALTPERKAPQRLPRALADEAVTAAFDFLKQGGSDRLARLLDAIEQLKPRPFVNDLLSQPAAFALLSADYEANYARSSFHHYFWAVQMLLGGLLAMCLAPLPPARAYHSISTGFAGLLAARAGMTTGRPACITEHGIYLLERQIEILMADWIGDQIDSGLALERRASDLRDLWSDAFAHYATVCYDVCDPIIALYSENNRAQARLGASRDRLRVIPNGIDLTRFEHAQDQRDPAHPLVALIGRVVPIKDIKTFIRAAVLVHAQRPDVRFVVMGPCDEDPEYADECFQLVSDLKAEDMFTFAGRVRIEEWMPRIDLLVLTSLSEAQPLVILEGGACGIPSVAPDVGSCREMLEGPDKDSAPGGIITPLINPAATATAILTILGTPGLRAEMGEALRQRVQQDYSHAKIIGSYRTLYNDLRTAQDNAPGS